MTGVPPPPVLPKPPGHVDPSAPVPPLRPPPWKQQTPTNFRLHKYSRRSKCTCTRCFCCCFLILLIIIFIIGAALALLYLYYQPKPPSFHLQSFKLTKFVVTVGADGTFLDSAVKANIQAANLNKKIGFSYGPGQVKFSATDVDDTVNMGSDALAGFRQPTRDIKIVKMEAIAKRVSLDDSVGTRLKSEFKSKRLEVVVEIRTKIGLLLGGNKLFEFPVKVSCVGKLRELEKSSGVPKCTFGFITWMP